MADWKIFREYYREWDRCLTISNKFEASPITNTIEGSPVTNCRGAAKKMYMVSIDWRRVIAKGELCRLISDSFSGRNIRILCKEKLDRIYREFGLPNPPTYVREFSMPEYGLVSVTIEEFGRRRVVKPFDISEITDFFLIMLAPLLYYGIKHK